MSFLVLTKLIIYYLQAALYMLLHINKICRFQFFRVYVPTNFKVDVLFVLFAVMKPSAGALLKFILLSFLEVLMLCAIGDAAYSVFDVFSENITYSFYYSTPCRPNKSRVPFYKVLHKM